VTQLVGALCENRTKVILVSDRMVTTADNSLAFEHEAKFEMLAANALVLTAGTIHEPELIADARTEIGGRASIRQAVESLARSYRNVRNKRIEQEILQKYGISSFEDFYNKQRFLHEDTNIHFLRDIGAYQLGSHLLVGGVDQKAHLYYIADPGAYRSYDGLGFCCIGSGDRHAEPVFAFYGFKPSLPVSEVLQIAYEAKKRAEMAGGVGRETDAWIIDKEACYEIGYETIQQLEGFHQEQETFSQFRRQFEIKTAKIEYSTNQTGTP